MSDATAMKRLGITPPEPGRVFGRGHPAGDLLEAYEWRLLDEGPGFLRLRCPLPDGVRNPHGVLFGGFTPTYVDLLAILACRAGAGDGPRRWLMTLNLQVDYFEPIRDAFVAVARVVKQRGANRWVEVRFEDDAGELLARASATLRETEEISGD